MAIERTNTDKFQLLPEGRYRFSVLSRPEKKSTAKTTYRVWTLGAELPDVEGSGQKVTLVLFPWESRELLLVLGGKEEGKEVVWDDETVEGREFMATVVHEAYEDKETKEQRKKLKLENIEEAIPF